MRLSFIYNGERSKVISNCGISPMLKAGADALEENRSLDNYGLVAEIYRAMMRAALRTERSARPPHLLDDQQDEG